MGATAGWGAESSEQAIISDNAAITNKLINKVRYFFDTFASFKFTFVPRIIWIDFHLGKSGCISHGVYQIGDV